MNTNLLFALSALVVTTSGISLGAAMDAFGQGNTTNNSNVLSSTVDKETNDSQNMQIDPNLANNVKVQPEQARGTAMSNVSAQASDVKSVKLQDENGNLVYSVIIMKSNKTLDVKVDAINGTVVRIDQDIDNNDGAGEQETNDDNAFSRGTNSSGNLGVAGGNYSR